MSLESWKKEFYPIPADEVGERDALDHSIKKWEGLSAVNLERHELSTWFGNLMDSEAQLDINSSTCALCKHFVSCSGGPCPGCALYESRGKVRCDRRVIGEIESPYSAWSRGNPEPMQTSLLKAKEFVQIQQAKVETKTDVKTEERMK